MKLELLAAAGLGSGLMLLWAAAAVIPLVLHFLYRRRQITLPWAAMQLLLQVVERESRRVRIEQLLLLALRTLILLLLAVALSRPFWNSAASLSETQATPPSTTWLFGIDVSYSMDYREASQSRLAVAQRRALELLEAAKPGDAFALVALGNPPQAVVARPTFDQQAFASELSRLSINDAGCDVSGGLQLVSEMADSARRDTSLPESQRIVLLSDLGSDHWRAALEGAGEQLLNQLAGQSQLDVEVVAEPTPSNLAITSLQLTSLKGLVGVPIEVDITVANFSSTIAERVPVQLAIDEQTVASEYLDLAPRASGVVRLSFVPRSLGWSVVTASIPADRLLTDNVRGQAVEIGSDHNILFVEQVAGDSRPLQLALRPAGPRDRAPRLDSISAVELSAVDFSKWQVIVLCDLVGLDQAGYDALVSFVQSGGAMLCLLGPRTTTASWQERSRQLLGFELLQPSASSDWAIDPLEYRSPVVAPFAGFPDAGLLTTPIFRFWEIRPLVDQENFRNSGSTDWTVDLATGDGQPLIVRHKLGNGSVASLLSAPQSGTGAVEQAWNAMTTWPSLVPLLQELLQVTLDAGTENHTLTAGWPLVGKLQDDGTSTTRGDRMLTVTKPDGSKSRLMSEDRDATGNEPWSFTQTQQSGVYMVRDPQGREQPFVVNIDPSESELKSLQRSQLPQKASPPPADVSPTETALPVETSPKLSRGLLIGLGLLLLLESSLAWYLGRRVG